MAALTADVRAVPMADYWVALMAAWWVEKWAPLMVGLRDGNLAEYLAALRVYAMVAKRAGLTVAWRAVGWAEQTAGCWAEHLVVGLVDSWAVTMAAWSVVMTAAETAALLVGKWAVRRDV